jgi:signal transduction histidine kinase/CheY-like chemotaxis protein
VFSHLQTDLAASTPSTRAAVANADSSDEVAGVFGDDIRLVCTPRKVSPGRLASLLELASRAVGASRAGIGLLTLEGDLLEHLSCGLTRDEAVELEQSAVFLALLKRVMRQPAPTRLERVPESAPALLAGGSILGVPLSCAGRSRGVLYLWRRADQREFTREEEELLAPISAWLEQANLSEEARLLNRLRVLNEVTQAAAGNLDLTSILAVTMRALDRLFPLHVSSVWLVADEAGNCGHEGVVGPLVAEDPSPPVQPELLLAATSARPGQNASWDLEVGLRQKPEETVFGKCLLDGCAIYADLDTLAKEASGVNALRVQMLAKGGATTGFAVPLRGGERVVGILQSICMSPSGMTGEQVQLLYLVADLLGPAISNCRLFRHLSAAYEELRKTQSQLIQAEKMRALGELAGGVAHEFNNALCGVLGFLELALLNKSLDASNRGFLESARICATDAAQTVRRVQDFARWRRNELAGQLIDLDDFVRQTVELIRHKWEGLGAARVAPIQVVVETEENVYVMGNPAELREVLTNLAFNAVEAMPRGGTLTIRAGKSATEAWFCVQDTGIGISAAVRHRVFEPFFTTKGERGNGLGLSVAFGIVRRHAGEISVESEEGCGATFTVRLPLASAPTPGAPVSLPPRICAPNRRLRILAVEDEESVRRFLETALTQLGHHPRLASNAEEGAAALDESKFDVVLTDLGLPGASGEELARRVAAVSPGTPVVLLSGWADQLAAEHRSIPNISRILSKPVTLDTLAATLTAVAP